MEAYIYGSLKLSGGISESVQFVNVGSYTLTNTNSILLADPATANMTLTLPSSSANVGKRYTIVRSAAGANTVTVAAAGGNTIAGSATQVLTDPYQTLVIVSIGNNWAVL